MNIVEVYEDELRVSHRVIAENTDNKVLSVQKLITDNLKELEEFGKVRFKIEAIKNVKNKVNEEKTYYLNEPQATLLITFMRNNEIVKKFKVLLVKEFYKMKDYIKNKNYLPQANDRTSATIYCVNNAIEILKVNEASKILMLEKAYRSLRVDTSFLPNYAEEDITHSLTELLAKHNVDMSTRKFNQLLIQNGIVEVKTRKSTKGIKTYKALTNKGLKYGKNLVNPNNQRETQPHYFDNTFEELLDLVLN